MSSYQGLVQVIQNDKKPDISAMRTFGARAYVHIPGKLRTKLDPVSKIGVMVGYEPHTKGYL